MLKKLFGKQKEHMDNLGNKRQEKAMKIIDKHMLLHPDETVLHAIVGNVEGTGNNNGVMFITSKDRLVLYAEKIGDDIHREHKIGYGDIVQVEKKLLGYEVEVKSKYGVRRGELEVQYVQGQDDEVRAFVQYIRGKA
jgi:Bacterial PH domain